MWQCLTVRHQVLGAGASWHKMCFTCSDCKKMLDSSTMAEKEGQIYCKSCHGKRFGPKVHCARDPSVTLMLLL